jgi:hypothetical protein
MAYVPADGATVARTEACVEEEGCYTWLEDYLECLEGKDEYRKFQEHHDYAHEYYALMASLLA